MIGWLTDSCHAIRITTGKDLILPWVHLHKCSSLTYVTDFMQGSYLFLVTKFHTGISQKKKKITSKVCGKGGGIAYLKAKLVFSTCKKYWLLYGSTWKLFLLHLYFLFLLKKVKLVFITLKKKIFIPIQQYMKAFSFMLIIFIST